MAGKISQALSRRRPQTTTSWRIGPPLPPRCARRPPRRRPASSSLASCVLPWGLAQFEELEQETRRKRIVEKASGKRIVGFCGRLGSLPVGSHRGFTSLLIEKRS